MKRGHNFHNNGWILPQIELDLYFMIIYLRIKYESNTLMFSKDIKQKVFLKTEVHSAVIMSNRVHYRSIFLWL